ncbi:hypothetical protein ACLB1T_27855 [Escherichia coli]
MDEWRFNDVHHSNDNSIDTYSLFRGSFPVIRQATGAATLRVFAIYEFF